MSLTPPGRTQLRVKYKKIIYKGKCVLCTLGSQVINAGTIAKVEEKIPESAEKDNTSIFQSMQYLQNIAAASSYPGLSMAMQQRGNHQSE